MTKYIKNYTKYIQEQIKLQNITKKLLEYHHLQILHIQHERLIHLIILCLFTILFAGGFALFLVLPSVASACLLIIVAVVEVFYIRHYYLLENTVQKWYRYENYIIEFINNIGANTKFS